MLDRSRYRFQILRQSYFSWILGANYLIHSIAFSQPGEAGEIFLTENLTADFQITYI